MTTVHEYCCTSCHQPTTGARQQLMMQLQNQQLQNGYTQVAGEPRSHHHQHATSHEKN
jgi:hypothetical protein